ncbi:hypothetical protein DM48_334 [Burkholderia gladioli]|uniref:Uncharacterized protein n=1 Tax=Burkholderia gladioli TaxID=28095 RepID=A0AAW3EZ74_BURGA|nr:hypothetical protein [Burkholderia gladioli]KGC12816.1 hypothetical protein DM48_334 [Burkholderia gladioli]
MKNFNELVQLALPTIVDIPAPRQLDEQLIASCKDYSDAVCLCLESRLRRIREGEIAEYLGFSAPHLAKVKGGRGYLTTDQELILQRLCSNWAIKQYAEMREREIERLIEQDRPALSADMEAMVMRLVEQRLAEHQQRAVRSA